MLRYVKKSIENHFAVSKKMQIRHEARTNRLIYGARRCAHKLDNEDRSHEISGFFCFLRNIRLNCQVHSLRLLVLFITILLALPLLEVIPIKSTVVAIAPARLSPAGSQYCLQARSLQRSVLQNGTAELKQGDEVKREINSGETHKFSVGLTAGQYAKLVVEWQGIDLKAAIIKPDGKRLTEFETQVVAPGPSSVSIIAEQPGSYSIEIYPAKKLSVTGSYEVKLEIVRPLTSEDENRFLAEKTLAEAQHQKSKETTVVKYEQALRLWRDAGDPFGEANTLRSLANMHQTERELQKAENYYNLALALRRKINDRRGEAYTLMDIGGAYEVLNSSEKALEYYKQALQQFQEIADRRGQASANYSIGFAYALTGKMRESLKFYEIALEIQRAEKDRLAEARTLNSMGGAYGVLGDTDIALLLYEQAAPIWKELNDRYREAVTINNIGLIYDDWGDWQNARENYDAGLSTLKSLLNNDWKTCGTEADAQALRVCSAAASVLDNIGELYNSLGDPQSALLKFHESWPVRQGLKQPRGQGSTLSRICYATFLQGKPKEALGYCEQALPFHKTADDFRRLAYTSTIMGMIHVVLNEPQKAFDYYKQALKLQEDAGERRVQAITLDKMGDVYALVGDSKNAFDSYNQALRLWREVKDQDGETITLYNIARAKRDRGDLNEARKMIEQAIRITESLRVNVTGQRLRTYYFATKLNLYELDIDLKMRLHKAGNSGDLVASALEANERARARSLLDILAEGRIEAKGSVDQALKELLNKRLAIQRRLNVKAVAQTNLLNGKHTGEQAAASAKEIAELTTEYDEIEAQIRKKSPRYVTLTNPKILSAKEVQQQLLDDQTLLLEYALGVERSYLWAVTPTEIKGFELPKGAEIEEAARRFKKVLVAAQKLPGETAQQYLARMREADAQYRQQAVNLGQMLLGPVAGELGKKRLIIVAEGELQAIPFGALSKPLSVAGEKSAQAAEPAALNEVTPLITEHEIVGLPSASTLALIREGERLRKPPPKTVAVLADPVFERDDPRLQTALKAKLSEGAPSSRLGFLGQVLRDFGPGLPRLFSSRQEAKAIIAAAPAGTGMEALDFTANRATATNPLLGQYRIVHFATHGILNDEYPELSGIVLSLYDDRGRPQEDGFLRLHDIYNLNLPVDLVVLSACRTGLGKNIRGEGLIGLTRGFMYAGASRIVASLWKVDDEATAELMKRFYGYMLKDGRSPAAALRQAQLSMREQKRWHDPYFWAGFILQGEWK